MRFEICKMTIDSPIRVLGHTFHGLEEIKDAVEVKARIHDSMSWGHDIMRAEPKKPVPGIHVLVLYEPYPCFDSSDYDYENRRYWNFFFSGNPFSDEDVKRLAAMRTKANYCMVYEGMDTGSLPAVYFEGSSWHDLVVAVLEP